jgi:hypothetical protein
MLKIKKRSLCGKRGKRGNAERAEKYPFAEMLPFQNFGKKRKNASGREKGQNGYRNDVKIAYEFCNFKCLQS